MSAIRIARLVTLTSLLVLFVTTGIAHAGVVTRDGSVLIYTSNPGQADALYVRQGGASQVLFDDQQSAVTTTAPNCQVINFNVLCTNVVWTAVRVDLRDGDDFVSGAFDAGTTMGIPMTILGGAGKDQLIGGNAADTIDTGVDGGNAFGGLGNDTLRASDPSTLNGAEGDDTLDAREFSSTVPNAQVTMFGGDGNDTFRAGSGRTIQFGDAGDDQLFGGSGNDALFGNAGHDTLMGGAGDDTLAGGSTQTGNTQTSDGQDTIVGGEGIDTLSYAGRTTAVTVDLATAGGDGEAGENDATSADIENIIGGNGADTLLGNGQSNDINGLRGADTIDGRGGFDQLRGGDDADTITSSGDGVADFIDCGSSFTTNMPPLPEGSDADTANVDHLDLIALTGDCETVNRLAPPQLPQQVGTQGDDTLRGTSAADELLGLGGNDIIFGFGGNDRLRGGTGNDKLYGGAGNDDIDGDAGNDQLFGQAGNDSLDGGRGNDLLLGGPGNDTLTGGFGRDNLNGGPGRDFLLASDGQRGDVVTCTPVALGTVAGRRQRDVVVADRGDVIRNRRFCAKVTIA